MIKIRIAQDVDGISQMIIETLFRSNGKDYPQAELENLAQSYSGDGVKRIAREGHLYAVYCDGALAGCGAVLPRDEDSCLLSTLFILPRYQGRGIGRKLMASMEGDPLASEKRCVLFASITAVGFYEKLGYSFQQGIKQLNENRVYVMEK